MGQPDEVYERAKNEWKSSAQYWRRHEAVVRGMFTALTDALVAAADFAPGQRVLDVAGGPGEPSLRIAEHVRPGLVAHTDLAYDMALAARDEANRLGLSNVTHALVEGQHLCFRNGSFDRVVSRLGFMFMPEPVETAAGFLRALKPGGKVVLVVWGLREENPYFRIPSEVVARHVPSPPDPPDAPTAWRYAESDKLAALLRAAGASKTGERAFEFIMRSHLTFDEFWSVRQEMSGSLREKLAKLDDDGRRAVRDEIEAELGEYFADGSMAIPAKGLVVWAEA